MLDILSLRKDLDAVVARLQQRKNPQPYLDVAAFTALENERKTLQTRTEDLQSQRNSLSKQIGGLKAKGESVDAQL
jgi:seryl-tRNA synthetase